ncbi:hypothetical protein E6C60_3832 [Paenibacillus algicola]|uniref:Uncharacterized protein n=1 Tax=Paenibacillus algicola TaxID=2565926 RepID=A0A4P8XNS5_9BACL|nr:hypothetical protein E6C60_3832 [Paenibacillus algicola]
MVITSSWVRSVMLGACPKHEKGLAQGSLRILGKALWLMQYDTLRSALVTA